MGGLGAAYWYVWRALPKTSGKVTAPISAKATIVRDDRGVPHITAATQEDAWFLQGLVTAQDRLIQMEVARRQASGELAEVFGPAAVEADLEARRLRMRRLAQMHAQRLSPQERTAFAAYARGVNFHLESHRDRLPVEFRILGFDPSPWTITDTVLVGLQMFRTLSGSWKEELQKKSLLSVGDKAMVDRLFPSRTGGEIQMGSNAWALAGRRTKSGKPLLANDPHLFVSLPGIWYQIHLTAPGLNVAGVCLPGIPGVTIGHNHRIAWGMTMLQFDVQDLYEEKLNPQLGVYSYKDQIRPLLREEELVRVRGGRPIEFPVYSTHHGPVFATEQNHSYALRWAGAEPGVFAYPLLEINQARGWEEFRRATSRFPGPAANFVYADVEGNIGLQVAGQLPLRRSLDGDVPAQGWTGEQEWDGFIPFEDLPSVFNPPSGAVITANQNPFPENYKHRVHGGFATYYRARQIQNLLSSRDQWDPLALAALQRDIYSPFSHFLARHLVAACNRRIVSNPGLKDALELLSAWNGQMEAGQAAPFVVTLAFQHLRKAAAERAAAGKGPVYEAGMAPAVLEGLLRERPAAWFADYDQVLVRVLADAVEEGTRIQGKNVRKWEYGRYNVWLLKHPVLSEIPVAGQYFRIGPEPMSGSTTTVRQTTPRVGPSMRYVADLADWDNSLLTTVTGQTAMALSSHYKDQWKAYSEGGDYRFRFSRIQEEARLEVQPAVKK